MRSEPLLDRVFFQRDALRCARDLIGCQLVRGPCRGLVIETEAYREAGDPACHLFTRPSARDFARNHPAGTAYVYLNYGVHWLANVLCLDPDSGEAGFVLIRALDPLDGLEEMAARRRSEKRAALCSGPGKLARALGIDGSHHGRSLVDDPAFSLRLRAKEPAPEVVADRRIGISAARELPWRFLLRGHPGVSVPAGKAK